MNRSVILAAFGLSMIGLSSVSAAEKRYGPGVTDTEIKLGQTMPYSGPISALSRFGRVEAAYLKMINAAGGINGRKVTLVSLDDAFAWYAPGDVNALAREYEGWDAPVRDMIAALDHTFRWGIAPHCPTGRAAGSPFLVMPPIQWSRISAREPGKPLRMDSRWLSCSSTQNGMRSRRD